MKKIDRHILLEELRDALQREDDLTFDMELEAIEEWDSLATLSVLTLYDEIFGEIVDEADLENCITVDDLINIVLPKKE